MSWISVAQSSPAGPIHCMALDPPTGPSLFFLHGVTRNARDWGLVMSALAARFTPYAIDLRGHGQSARSTKPYRVASYVDDVVRVAREVIARPTILIGHSLGAMLALAAAPRLREQVTALVLEDPPFETLGTRVKETIFLSQFRQFHEILSAERWSSVADLAQQIGQVRLDHPITGESFLMSDVRDAATLRFHASSLAQMDPAALAPIVDGSWLDGFHWREIASQIDVPTLLLQADPSRGGMLTDADVLTLRQSIRDLTVVSFPGVGHQIHSLAREQFLSTVGPFLESLTADDSPPISD